MKPRTEVEIESEYIKLDQLLKFAGEVMSGAEAKQRILNGEIRVNGEVCTQRGKKLRESDEVDTEENSYLIRLRG